MPKTIYDYLSEYKDKAVYPFHMPGHKRNSSYSDDNFLSFDITEIPEMDNLHYAEGIILKAQKRAAEVFGADESFFLVNGSTGGLISAILAAVYDGETILVARNCHRSVYSGIALSGAKPVYIMPDITEYGIPGGVSPKGIEAMLENDDSISLVIITSPTYEGFVSDIESIAEIVHRKNKILIVDEAHGSHFSFSPFFPKSAIQCGADIAVQSLHKTLPVLTQTSVLHTKGGRISIDRLKSALSMIQTSSPSYVFLAFADRCIDMFSKNDSIFASYADMLSAFREKIENLEELQLIGQEIVGNYNIFDIDLGKLVFYINSNEINGKTLEQELLSNYGLQIEMSGMNHIIAMTSPADTNEGFEKLYKGISEISKGLTYDKKTAPCISMPEIPRLVYSPRESISKPFPRSCVSLRKSIGKISADFIISYPPGIPLIVPGEEISQSVIEHIEVFIKNNIPLLGQDDIKRGFINIFT